MNLSEAPAYKQKAVKDAAKLLSLLSPRSNLDLSRLEARVFDLFTRMSAAADTDGSTADDPQPLFQTIHMAGAAEIVAAIDAGDFDVRH